MAPCNEFNNVFLITCAGRVIAIGTCLITRCLASISCPLHVCESSRLPQTHVLVKVAVRSISRSVGGCWLRCGWRASQFISPVSAVFFSITLPVIVDTQVVGGAVKFITRTSSRSCGNWRSSTLKSEFLITNKFK